MRGKAREALARWIPSAVWMAVIFGFSTLSGSTLRPVSGFSTFGHLGEYAILGGLLFVALRKSMPPVRAALLAVAIASAYGVTDELHQFLTPGRTPDVMDWAADTGGALAGAVVTWALRHRMRRRT
jgi:VanZ family protein